MGFQIDVGLLADSYSSLECQDWAIKKLCWLLQLLWVQILLLKHPFLFVLNSVEFVMLSSASKGVHVWFPNSASWNLRNEGYIVCSTYFLSKSAHITTNLFWMICSISLPITILNRLVILNDDISTEEIEITCSVIGVFRLPKLDQALILVQRSLSYCMIEDSIVKTGRHADVILLA